MRVGRRAVRGAEISRSEASGPLEARSNTVTLCSGIAGSLDMDVPPRKSSEVEAARNKTSFFGPPPLQGFLEDADALLGSLSDYLFRRTDKPVSSVGILDTARTEAEPLLERQQ